MNRDAEVELMLSKVRPLMVHGTERGALDKALEALMELAAKQNLWGPESYPDPDGSERQARYLIAQDDPRGLTLYLNVMLPGKKIPPHNHTTWACVAAVDGSEFNTLYRRLDDGSVAGQSQIEVDKVVEVMPGTGVALMPDDIHHVEIRGTRTIRHLHMYGQPLETLSERLTFDMAAGTNRVMPIGVQSRR